jgi:predicted nucleotidyltransferase
MKLAVSTGKLVELGVKSLSVFGSVATGQATEGSDIDFLVEFEGPATFARYMGLKELLEGEFLTRVDLVTLRSLNPRLRDQILGEAVKDA